MTFSDSIRREYRVVKTQYGNGEFEETIPLGSWRKGGGLAGKKGHVYAMGELEAGIWLIGGRICRTLAGLIVGFPTLKTMQCGDGEATFSIPWSDLPGLLPVLKAKRLSTNPGRSPEALAEARRSSPIGKSVQKRGG